MYGARTVTKAIGVYLVRGTGSDVGDHGLEHELVWVVGGVVNIVQVSPGKGVLARPGIALRWLMLRLIMHVARSLPHRGKVYGDDEVGRRARLHGIITDDRSV